MKPITVIIRVLWLLLSNVSAPITWGRGTIEYTISNIFATPRDISQGSLKLQQ